MNKRYILGAGLAILILAAAVPFLYAQPMRPHGHGGFGFFGHLDKAKAKLGLTDDQVAQIKAIADDLKTKNAPYRDQVRGGFQSIATTLLNNPNDVAAAQTLLDQQNQAEQTMKSNTLTAVSKALNVLTADQRAKVAQFLADRKARHNGGQ
ncbi:MAG: Spy/CpxP family protein refolding chaperone [Thermoanaerobaculia bacterium]